MTRPATSVLAWVAFCHLAGLYLFTRGFLLTRLSLPNVSTCSTLAEEPCTLPPTHSRAVLLIIDALRFDFISPHPPEPQSPHYHDVLTLPRELTTAHPDRSVLFNAYPDPPTTTLQRIKGLVTGSLPTFVDMGSNFGGSSIEEDSIVAQLRNAGKKVAFMGDDTWMTVFPSSFEPSLSFPYDSFNVEDLHTVDEGVIRHLFPLLTTAANSSAPREWDFLIGHFLGVDHVGHRVGPDHPSMQAKLLQMNDVLSRVTELLPEDTLLIVLGDHGMDRRGDHGGDGDLETNAGMWLYSKTPFVSQTAIQDAPASLTPHSIFPGETVPHRRIQQIDLLPTLSLLLGLPIPFNNLGAIIPELFPGSLLRHALGANAAQVKAYLQAYRDSASGGELDGVWEELQVLWPKVPLVGAPEAEMVAYIRAALEACRSLWAQFDGVKMMLGLGLLVVSLLSTWAVFTGLAKEDPQDYSAKTTRKAIRGAGVGLASGFIAFLLSKITQLDSLRGMSLVDWMLLGAPLTGSLVILSSSVQRPQAGDLIPYLTSLPIPIVLHAVSFLSNSFILWEDRAVQYLLLTTLIRPVRVGLAAPTPRARRRILGCCVVFAICVRLMAISTVCREEQQPYCHVTFFAGSTLPSPPWLIRILAFPLALALPSLLHRALGASKSDGGAAALVLPWVLRPTLLAGAGYWMLEWMDSAEVLGAEFSPILRTIRTLVAWVGVGWTLIGGFGIWWTVPSCLQVIVERAPPAAPDAAGKATQVTVLGYANAFGAPYLVFWTVVLGLVFATAQLTGQAALFLTVVALLAHLELVDAVRDVERLAVAFASGTPSAALLDPNSGDVQSALTPRDIKFKDTTPLALLAVHAFYSTGHQSTISSIQWKTAFMLTPSLTYPFSPILVVLNTFGPTFLVALGVPLLGLWNVAPRPATAVRGAQASAARAGLGVMLYFGALLLGSAVSAAVLRRHLMVWKVFAPRFMSAAVGLIAVDVAILFGVALGVSRVTVRVSQIFARMDNGPKNKTR